MDQAGVHVDDLHCAGILGWPGWPTGHLTTASAYPGGGQCSQYTTAHPVTGTSIFKITAFIFIIKLIILQLPTGHISDISKVANTNSAKKRPMHANGGKVLDSIGFVRPERSSERLNKTSKQELQGPGHLSRSQSQGGLFPRLRDKMDEFTAQKDRVNES